MPSAEPEIRFIPRPDGTHDVAILIQQVKMRRSKDGTEWWLIDSTKSLQERVVCDGFLFRPHFILKLFCKAPRQSWPEMRHRLLMDKLRRKVPSLEYSL